MDVRAPAGIPGMPVQTKGDGGRPPSPYCPAVATCYWSGVARDVTPHRPECPPSHGRSFLPGWSRTRADRCCRGSPGWPSRSTSNGRVPLQSAAGRKPLHPRPTVICSRSSTGPTCQVGADERSRRRRPAPRPRIGRLTAYPPPPRARRRSPGALLTARIDPMADASLPDMRARIRPGNGDGGDDADDGDDDQQLDQGESSVFLHDPQLRLAPPSMGRCRFESTPFSAVLQISKGPRFSGPA